MTKSNPFRHFKTSPEIIRLAVMIYFCFWARGDFSTTNGAITEDIVFQYLEQHIADPTAARWSGCRPP
jgi:hypothetical protein